MKATESGLSDPLGLFSQYLRVTGVAHLGPEPLGAPELRGRRLGLLNGSSWITLWANYFGRLYLPGVHLVNVGNDAVQMNFMQAHRDGLPCPPRSNIDAFVRYARDLVDLAAVDAVLITCSTMNRAYTFVREALAPKSVPVVQIDRPMMDEAVASGGSVLVVATHGPTVESTQALLRAAAIEAGREVSFTGITVPEAWARLAAGDIQGHNGCLDGAIAAELRREPAACVVLAQLSMSVLLLSHPDPLSRFGVPVLSSARCGFQFVRRLLAGLPVRHSAR